MARIATAEVEVVADVSRFLANLRRQLSGLSGDFDRIGNQLGRSIGNGINNGLRDQLGRINVEVNRSVGNGEPAGQRWSSSFVRSAQRGLLPFRNTEIIGSRDGDRAGRNWGRAFFRAGVSALSGFGRAIAASVSLPFRGLGELFQEVPSEVGIFLAAITAIYGVLLQIGPLLAGIPAALGLIGAAALTVVAAFDNFGDIFRNLASGDLDAVRAAMDDLTPSAQRAVEELIEMREAFDGLFAVAQEALFAQIDGQIRQLADTLAGPLRSGLEQSGAGLGELIAQFLEFAGQEATGSALEAIFSSLGQIFSNLSVAVQPFFEGLRDAAVVLLPRFEQFSTVIADMLTRFGEFLSASAQLSETANRFADIDGSGGIVEGFDRAVDSVQAFFDLLSEVGRLLSAVFDAGVDSGTGFFNTIQTLIGGLADLAESAQGQEALGSVFTALGDIVTSLLPAVGALVSGIGQLAPIIADIAAIAGPALAMIFDTLADALADIGPGLTTLFSYLASGLATIATAFEPVGGAVNGILEALAPLLPVIGEIGALLATVFSEALVALTPLVEGLVTLLTGVLTPLIPIISEVSSTLISGLAPVFQTLGDFLTELTPLFSELIIQLGDALVPVVEALIPLFDGIVNSMDLLLPSILELVSALAEALLPILPILSELLVQIIDEVGVGLFNAIVGLLPIIVEMAEFFAEAVQMLAPFLEILFEVAGVVAGYVVVSLGFLVDIISVLVGWIADIVGGFYELMTVALPYAYDFGFEVGQVFAEIIGWIESVLMWFYDLGAGIGEAVGDAIEWLNEFFDSVVGVFQDIEGWINDLVGWFLSIPDRIAGVFQSVWDLVPDFGDILPFADGGIVSSPTLALIGEAGREVVIPLSRPDRAIGLAQQSGLVQLLMSHGAFGSPDTPTPAPHVEMHVHSNSVDPDLIARRAVNRIVRAVVNG